MPDLSNTRHARYHPWPVRPTTSPRAALRRAALLGLALAACATPPRREPQAAPPSGPTALPAQGGEVRPAVARDAAPRTTARVTLGAVGDVMFQEAVKRAAAVHGAGWPDDGFAW